MRASQDKNSDPASKNSQGLTGQKAPYDPKTAKADKDIVRQPGYVAPSGKEQLQRDIDWNLKQGYASDRDLTLQQKYERDNLMRDTFPSKTAQPSANQGSGWRGFIKSDGSLKGSEAGIYHTNNKKGDDEQRKRDVEDGNNPND